MKPKRLRKGKEHREMKLGHAERLLGGIIVLALLVINGIALMLVLTVMIMASISVILIAVWLYQNSQLLLILAVCVPIVYTLGYWCEKTKPRHIGFIEIEMIS